MGPLQFFQDNYKAFVLTPFLVMNGTLALMETIQRFLCFDKEEVVGAISELLLAPVGTTKLLSVDSWDVTVVGPKYNKRFAVYRTSPEISKLFATQAPGSKLLEITSRFVGDDELCLSHNNHSDLRINLSNILFGERLFGIKHKTVDNDGREYLKVGKEADEWMSNLLGISATMLYMPEVKLSGECNYPVYCSPDNKPAPVAPVHITAISTLEKMNETAGTQYEMERFRPNIVVKGSKPGAEGFWKVIRIGGQLELEHTFMNPRCSEVNMLGGKRADPKVYDTVYKYGPFRDTMNRPCFGTYWKVLRPGKVCIGDKIILLKSQDCGVTGLYSLTDEFVVGTLR